jgi:hypothetical protein
MIRDRVRTDGKWVLSPEAEGRGEVEKSKVSDSLNRPAHSLLGTLTT